MQNVSEYMLVLALCLVFTFQADGRCNVVLEALWTIKQQWCQVYSRYGHHTFRHIMSTSVGQVLLPKPQYSQYYVALLNISYVKSGGIYPYLPMAN